VLITGIPGDLSLAYLRAMFESGQRGGSLDYADFHVPSLDALFASARGAATEAESRRAWIAVQVVLDRDMPASWLYHSRGLQGVSARMRDVRMDLRGELVTLSRWTTDAGADSRAVARR
jgi:ABC-type transport system substrate-binding protein